MPDMLAPLNHKRKSMILAIYVPCSVLTPEDRGGLLLEGPFDLTIAIFIGSISLCSNTSRLNFNAMKVLLNELKAVLSPCNQPFGPTQILKDSLISVIQYSFKMLNFQPCKVKNPSPKNPRPSLGA